MKRTRRDAGLSTANPRSFYGARPDTSISTRLLNVVRRGLRRTNSSVLGASSRRLYIRATQRRGKHLGEQQRVLLSLLQPHDPLKREKSLPAIDLVVPFVEKDLRSLELVLQQALRNVRNPISRIVLITPQNSENTGPRFIREESHQILADILSSRSKIVLRHDQDVLGPEILAELENRFGRGDRNAGWVTQQLIKLSAALASEAPASLILDADTLLLSKKTWLNSSGRQLLQLANEYHTDFMKHTLKHFGVPKELKMSFVTHHQLMQTDVVRRMFPEGGASLVAWWQSSTDAIGRDLGDYEVYGAFLAHHYPTRVAHGSFANLFSPHLTTFLADRERTGWSPERLIPGYCSVSFHSWAQVDRADRGD